MKRTLIVGLVLSIAASASATMRITEWMYSGAEMEYIEFTNWSAVPIDLTGWSYDDDSATSGEFDLGGFGVVQPGEVVVITENDPAAFKAAWGLTTTKVLGPYTNNLGRNDQINLFDGLTLVDTLTYGDQNLAGSIRTQNISGWTMPANLGIDNVYAWQLSVVGDALNSWTSVNADIGNPSVYFPIPEPATLSLLAFGLLHVRRRVRA